MPYQPPDVDLRHLVDGYNAAIALLMHRSAIRNRLRGRARAPAEPEAEPAVAQGAAAAPAPTYSPAASAPGAVPWQPPSAPGVTVAVYIGLLPGSSQLGRVSAEQFQAVSVADRWMVPALAPQPAAPAPPPRMPQSGVASPDWPALPGQKSADSYRISRPCFIQDKLYSRAILWPANYY